MKGTVFFRQSKAKANVGKVKKPGTYTYQFEVPAPGGGRRFITKGGYSTKKAAEEALTCALAEYGRAPGAVVEPSKMLLVDYLRNEWLPSRTRIKPTTRAGYLTCIERWIAPHLGHVRLCDLTPGQITKMYGALRTGGGLVRKGVARAEFTQQAPTEPLSERTVHKSHVVLTAALGYATQTGLLKVNPMTLIPKDDRPKQNGHDRPEMKAWTAEQARTFLEACEGERLLPVYDLALNTGMRRGELAGLRWEDIDLERRTVAVRRNRVLVNFAVHNGTPKNSKARAVDIDEETVAMLKRWRRQQLEERMAWGSSWSDTGYVFTYEDGEPLHPSGITSQLRRLIRKAGVPTIRLHDLRHTHATLGLAAGVPVKVMQERLGHGSSQITLDLYSHVIPGMGADAASKIAGLLRRAQ